MEIIHVPPSMNSNDINPLAWKSNGHLRCKKLYSVLLFENKKLIWHYIKYEYRSITTCDNNCFLGLRWQTRTMAMPENINCQSIKPIYYIAAIEGYCCR